MSLNLWHLGFAITLFSLTNDFRQLKSVGYAGKWSQPWETYSHAPISESTLWNMSNPFLKERRRNVTVFSSYTDICYSGRCLEPDSSIDCGRGLYDFSVYLYNEPSKGQILPHWFWLGIFLSQLINTWV